MDRGLRNCIIQSPSKSSGLENHQTGEWSNLIVGEKLPRRELEAKPKYLTLLYLKVPKVAQGLHV